MLDGQGVGIPKEGSITFIRGWLDTITHICSAQHVDPTVTLCWLIDLMWMYAPSVGISGGAV